MNNWKNNCTNRCINDLRYLYFCTTNVPHGKIHIFIRSSSKFVISWTIKSNYIEIDKNKFIEYLQRTSPNCPASILFSVKYIVKYKNRKGRYFFIRALTHVKILLWKKKQYFYFEPHIIESIKDGKKFFKQKLYSFKNILKL